MVRLKPLFSSSFTFTFPHRLSLHILPIKYFIQKIIVGFLPPPFSFGGGGYNVCVRACVCVCVCVRERERECRQVNLRPFLFLEAKGMSMFRFS